MPGEENPSTSVKGTCAICEKDRCVVADCKSWHLANSNETIAKRINAWQRNKNPFVDASRLFAEGVEIDTEGVTLPICQPCLSLVIDIDRLEACLKDRFDTLWDLMKFNDDLALEFEVVYENDAKEDQQDDTPLPVEGVGFDFEPEFPPSSPPKERRSRGRPKIQRSPRPPKPKLPRGRPKKTDTPSPSLSGRSGSSFSPSFIRLENGLVNGSPSGRKNKGNLLKQVLDRVKSRGLSPDREENVAVIRSKHAGSNSKTNSRKNLPKSAATNNTPAVKASPRSPKKRKAPSSDEGVKKSVKRRRLTSEEVALRVNAGLIAATSAIALKRAVGVRPWLTPDCRACKHFFPTHMCLRAHCAETHDGMAPYVCHFCLLEFTTLADFAGHVMYEELQRSSKGGFKCGNCGEDCRLPGLLAQHMKKCYGSGDQQNLPFACNECGVFFGSFAGFVKHRREPLPQHVKKNGKRPEFKCRDCKSHCPSEDEFIEHYQNAHNVAEPFGCARCGQMFASLELLHMHFVTVEFAKKHVCKRCGMRFTDLSLAEGHRMKSHALDRGLTCLNCSAVPKSVEAREKHLRDHTQGACPFCTEDFWTETPEEVDEHYVKNHADELKLMCPVCDVKLEDLNMFRWHVRVAHKREDYRMHCDACDTGFRNRLEYALHKCVLSNSRTTDENKSPGSRSTLLNSLTSETPSQTVPGSSSDVQAVESSEQDGPTSVRKVETGGEDDSTSNVRMIETTEKSKPRSAPRRRMEPVPEDLLSSVMEEVFSPGESYPQPIAIPIRADGGWMFEACQEEVIEGTAVVSADEPDTSVPGPETDIPDPEVNVADGEIFAPEEENLPGPTDS